jgi:hypothetical protein
VPTRDGQPRRNTGARLEVEVEVEVEVEIGIEIEFEIEFEFEFGVEAAVEAVEAVPLGQQRESVGWKEDDLGE